MTLVLEPSSTTLKKQPGVWSTDAPAVECDGLTKDFGHGEATVHALRGVETRIYRGGMTLIVGPSGCGKTTLLSVIVGLLSPTTGKVTVLGQDLTRLADRDQCDFRARHVGFVFQQYNLIPALTAAENAAIPLVILGKDFGKAVDLARPLLAAMGLEHRMNAYPRQLSVGEQQRVAIARALVNRPELLVCDEPTAALDADAGKRVMEFLRSAALDPDRAVIIVTHDDRVLGFGDRIIRMQDGRVTSDQSGGTR
jgi:putative ABC transport system ATP-binding protein